MVYVRHGLHRFVTRVQPVQPAGVQPTQLDAPECVWLRVSKQCLVTGRDILLCAAYLPPVQTNACSDLQVEQLWEALTNTALPSDDVMLLGDLNAHTGIECDIPNHAALEQLGGTVPQGLAAHLSRDAYDGIPLQRSNSSPVTATTKGIRLVELICRGSGLVIANGSSPGDMHGACTYPTARSGNVRHKPSQLDLLLLPSSLMHRLTTLRVLDDTQVASTCQITIPYLLAWQCYSAATYVDPAGKARTHSLQHPAPTALPGRATAAGLP